jgi:hypothetical protein
MRAAAMALVFALAGCVSAPHPADLLQPHDRPAAAERRFEGVRAEDMQPAVVAVLQDLGFQMRASELEIGLIVGTRGQARSDEEAAAAFGRYMGVGLKNAVTFQWHIQPNPLPFVGPQSLSAVVTITPEPKATAVRLTLHRFVRQPTGEALVVWAEEVPGPQAQRDFFALLGKALGR